MGKRYYCDYCDRSFKDVPATRKKHLESLQHLKNKEEHYKYFKDPEIILKEEKMKNPCNRFLFKGECLFGSSCRYSHYSPAMIQQLQYIVDTRNKSKEVKTYNPDPQEVVKFLEDSIKADEITEIEKDLWPRIPGLDNIPNLPPSLRPISYKDFTDGDFPDWGWM
ncbi:zinc finger matrin-type protein 5 [Nasonia vitripennis]|uniref:C3H1-type domain-containing protein n=1 Tax=Nasonia vitripennis TaxID=7425 RepID=A0A7M7GA28_NASVI|nr:zinc finger matrin-type protein 5 [Nasonia vitripennis]